MKPHKMDPLLELPIGFLEPRCNTRSLDKSRRRPRLTHRSGHATPQHTELKPVYKEYSLDYPSDYENLEERRNGQAERRALQDSEELDRHPCLAIKRTISETTFPASNRQSNHKTHNLGHAEQEFTQIAQTPDKKKGPGNDRYVIRRKKPQLEDLIVRQKIVRQSKRDSQISLLSSGEDSLVEGYRLGWAPWELIKDKTKTSSTDT